MASGTDPVRYRPPGADDEPAAAVPADDAPADDAPADDAPADDAPADDVPAGPPPDPLRPLSREWSRRVTLRDGTKVLLRPIRPEDRARIESGLARLSPASRYLRFHAAIDHLSERQLDYLVDVDHVDHEAIVAIDLDRPDRPGVGVARYIRELYEPHVAEAAITVADEYHGMGAGTILLGALAARAREHGIDVFRSYVLDGNPGMLEVFDHLGAHRELETDGLWRVDLDVPHDEADVPDSAAGRAFLEAAREHHGLASLIPPIWSRLKRRRHGADDAPAGQRGTEREADAEFEELAADLNAWLAAREDR